MSGLLLRITRLKGFALLFSHKVTAAGAAAGITLESDVAAPEYKDDDQRYGGDDDDGLFVHCVCKLKMICVLIQANRVFSLVQVLRTTE